MYKEIKGKSVIVNTENTTSRGRVIRATMKVDSKLRNYIHIKTEASRDHRESTIYLTTIDELKTFKKIIEDLEKEYEAHSDFLNQ